MRQPRRAIPPEGLGYCCGPFCACCVTPPSLVTRCQAIYSTMENPSHSIISRLYEMSSMSLVIATTAAFVLEKEEFASSDSAKKFFS